ncbi:MAG TPA: DUF4126 domain-containing protein [Capsulimonadaceae bacterium]|jgi:hypothetical protein
MESIGWITAVCLGLGLAASTGLNTFLPLLIAAVAGRFMGVHLGEHFSWLTSNTAIATLAIATVLDTIADKVPAVDHALHAVGAFVRPLVAALAAASVLPADNGSTAAIIGLIIGSPAAFAFHAAKAGTRVASSALSFGMLNPVISIAEDFASAGLTIASLLLPLFAPVFVVAAFALIWQITKRAKAAKQPQPSVPTV